MEITKFWPLALRAAQALGDLYEPRIGEITANYELDTTLLFDCLLAAEIFKPEPITVERLRVRSPYTSPKLYAEKLANAAAGGFLRPVEQAGYVLSEKGSRVMTELIQAIYTCLAQASPLRVEKLEQLAEQLWKLVEASLAAPEPPGHWCLAYSRKLDPGPPAPVTVRLDQYLSDLAAYRDDAHLASWQDSGVDAPAWDALTCLWRESPLALDQIFARLKRRGWAQNDYAVRLEELIRRGWVEQKGEGFSILEPGRRVRQAAEQLTDEYFYRPWDSFSEDELTELEELLTGIVQSMV